MNKEDRLKIIAARFHTLAGAYAKREKPKTCAKVPRKAVRHNWGGYRFCEEPSKRVRRRIVDQHEERQPLTVRVDDHEESPLTRAARLILGKKWYWRT